jgi:hypothetical protein
MRIAWLALCTILLSLQLSGCATNKQASVLDRVGPASTEPGAGKDGSLLVFSAPDTSGHFNTVPYRPIYSDYVILTEDGKLLQNVINRDARRNSPNPVSLPAGKYRVVARANGYGNLTVPVLIVDGRLTTVHLDGPGSWTGSSSVERSNLVCLTDGQIVGYRANTTEIPASNSSATH